MTTLAHGAARRAALAMAVAVPALLSAGCSLFGPDRPDPKPLPAIAAPISVRSVWNQPIGDVRFPLAISIDGATVTLAAGDGSVVALEAETGKTLWRANVGAKLSAGVGSDGRSAAVVTRDNELVSVESGQVRWRRNVGVRVATAPLVAGERVFVLGIDRAVQAFDGQTGSRLWQLQRPGDPLTLAQGGVITAFQDTLVVGQGPRLAGLDPSTSAVRWEVAIGAPRGANEVERLADLVGPPVRSGNLLCARSFQAAVGCVDAARGRVAWTKTIGGIDAIGGDGEQLFGADGSDRITAWKTASGDVDWTSEALMFRRLAAPAVIGSSVVFGADDGTLHWLSRAKGEPQARTPTDGSPIVAQPVVVGQTLIVVTRKGGVFAFRVG